MLKWKMHRWKRPGSLQRCLRCSRTHSLYNENLRVVVFSVHHGKSKKKKACTIRVSYRIRFRYDLVRYGDSSVSGSRSAPPSYRPDTKYACPASPVQLWKKEKVALKREKRERGMWEDILTSNSKHNSKQIAITHSHSLLTHAHILLTHSHSHGRVAKTL